MAIVVFLNCGVELLINSAIFGSFLKLGWAYQIFFKHERFVCNIAYKMSEIFILYLAQFLFKLFRKKLPFCTLLIRLLTLECKAMLMTSWQLRTKLYNTILVLHLSVQLSREKK